MSNSARIIAFSIALGLICSALLAGINALTAPYRLSNEKAEEVRNILDALNVPVAPDATQADLVATFDRDVKQKSLGSLSTYAYAPSGGGTIAGYAIPFTGAGLWGPVSGVIALEPDLKTIRGVRFFKQEETPGLGGEISSDWFQKQFAGKKIISEAGAPGFSVLKPEAPAGPNSVDGITGATMTSNRVETMLTNVARDIFKETGKNGNQH
ncbi:MAG TPA: FMN-binding protein [Spirochaetia bacterium]|nr:FMN-binding protein [Spirochaetia bacterium]